MGVEVTGSVMGRLAGEASEARMIH
jgi:hypothetical protein